MKWTLAIAGVLLIVLLAALAFSLLAPERWRYRSEYRLSAAAIERIEAFRRAHNRLPESLEEAGIGKDLGPAGANRCPCYSKENDESYTVWFGTSLGESRTYHSDTRSWD